jgi:flagellar basal-body rod protein FlgC
MSNAANIALTSIRVFEKKMDVTANNISNVNTDDFKKSRAVLEEAYPSGVKVSISRVDTPGMPLPVDESNLDIKETSNVSLENEIADLIMMPTLRPFRLKRTWKGRFWILWLDEFIYNLFHSFYYVFKNL